MLETLTINKQNAVCHINTCTNSITCTLYLYFSTCSITVVLHKYAFYFFRHNVNVYTNFLHNETLIYNFDIKFETEIH